MQQLVSNGITNHFFSCDSLVFIYMMCHISAFFWFGFCLVRNEFMYYIYCFLHLYGAHFWNYSHSFDWFSWLLVCVISHFFIRLKGSYSQIATRDRPSTAKCLFQAEKLTFFLWLMPFLRQYGLFVWQYIVLELKLHLYVLETNELLLWMASLE